MSTQTLDFLASTFSCAAEWGLGSGERPPSENPLGEDFGGVNDDIGTAHSGADLVFSVFRSGTEAGLAGNLAASDKAYRTSLTYASKTDKALSGAGTVLTAVKVGVTVWDITQNGGWSSDPIEAWSNPDVYNDCLAEKFPDYTGLPPDGYPEGGQS